MVMKTYSYHVYQPKAKNKQGRFVDLDTKSGADASGRIRRSISGKDSRNPLVATTEVGPVMSDNPQLTPQLFAATHQAILKSQQQQQHVATAQGIANSGSFSSSQYTFQTFKMKGRNSQSSVKRLNSVSSVPNVGSMSTSATPGPLPVPLNFHGQPPLAIRPMMLSDLSMLQPMRDSFPSLAPHPLLMAPVSDPIAVPGQSEPMPAATHPSTPQLSGTSTPVALPMSPTFSFSKTSPSSAITEAATPPRATPLDPFDNLLLASLGNFNFSHLTEQQQLDIMNAAVTQFAGLNSEKLLGHSSFNTQLSHEADSALSTHSLDAYSPGWDDASIFSESRSCQDSVDLLDESFLFDDFLL